MIKIRIYWGADGPNGEVIHGIEHLPFPRLSNFNNRTKIMTYHFVGCMPIWYRT